jgi:GNAT superfamily N-acetyltransferase
MTIAIADWHDILKVLHETYRIWSPGLSRSAYHQYIWGQISHPWSRRSFRYVVLKERDQVACSCKLYDLPMAARGQEYRVLGIGAVYTLEKYRSRGLAHQLIDDVIDLAEKESYDGVILYSEIGPEFYEEFGFVEVGATDFCAYLPAHHAVGADSAASSQNEDRACAPDPNQVPWLTRHYARWLRSRLYGNIRSQEYWLYKLSKERFLHKHSSLSWPQLELTAIENDLYDSGYMITERGGTTIRVLEVVGSEQASNELWGKLLKRATEKGITRIRGWESGVIDLAPGFSLAQVAARHSLTRLNHPIEYVERDWGRGMLLALSPELEPWHTCFPCPLLELDHV